MFVSEYRHTLDAKGRIIIPAKIREELADNFVLNRGLDGCIYIYTQERFNEIYNKLLSIPQTKETVRKYIRVMTANATVCNVDSQGRILIPAKLIQLANLEKECVIVGAGDHVEIWSKENWESFIDDANESFEAISEEITSFML